MTNSRLQLLLKDLCQLPGEEEWFEFKVNNSDPNLVGEYISALSNSARIIGKDAGYLIWGVEDVGHKVVGTTFRHREQKVSNQELENWLLGRLTPRVDIRFYELEFNGARIVVLEVPVCSYQPVRWDDVAYVRVGSYKKKLSEFPDKERFLWASQVPFENGFALRDVSQDAVLSLLNHAAYFDLTGQPLPSDKAGILDKFGSERVVVSQRGALFDITNFGAILFAKKLSNFPTLSRKAVRVVTYTGDDPTSKSREYVADEGYAVCFESVVKYINHQLPINEHISQAFRVAIPTYPEISIRELVANAIIHQDFLAGGTSPVVSIFPERLEVTNPGRPLISPLRFVDEPPRSRNEGLAGFMRRVGVCEELGRGIDKVVSAVELYQLPAPDFAETDFSTRATLFAKRNFADINGQDRIRACYWHACLLHVSGTQLTNESLRKRFGLDVSKHNQIGRIISDARKANLIKPYDPDNKSPRYARYVPFWH